MKNRTHLRLLLPLAVVCLVLQGFTTIQVSPLLSDMYNRVFSEEKVLLPNEKEYTKIEQEYLHFVGSKNQLAYAKTISKNSYEPNFQLTFLDPGTLNEVSTHKITIQDRSNIVYASSENVYYRHKLDFYEFNLASEEFTKLNDQNTTIFNMALLNKNTALCIGNIKNAATQKNNYGFFTYDLVKNEVMTMVKSLDPEAAFDPIENSLKYVGKFIESDSSMVYTFDMYGKILLFNKQGEVQHEIETIDKVTPPGITHYANMYTYKRGSTFYSNAASLVNDNYLYVFSCRPNNSKQIIVDKYNIESGGYVESYKLDYQNKKSNNINYIFQNGTEEFVLGFSNFFQGFDAKFDSCQE